MVVPDPTQPGSPLVTDKGSIFNRWVPPPLRCNVPELGSPYYRAIEATNGLFYNAKNLVFTHDNYFNELRLIQERMNFVRSLGMISSLLFASYLLFSFVCCLLPGWDIRSCRRLTFIARYVVFALAYWLYFTVGERHPIYTLRVVLVIGVAAIFAYELLCICFPKKKLAISLRVTKWRAFFMSPISNAAPADSDTANNNSDRASGKTLDRIFLCAIVAFLAAYLSFRAAPVRGNSIRQSCLRVLRFVTQQSL